MRAISSISALGAAAVALALFSRFRPQPARSVERPSSPSVALLGNRDAVPVTDSASVVKRGPARASNPVDAQVRLLEAGGSPRRVLVLDPKLGFEQHLSYEVATTTPLPGQGQQSARALASASGSMRVEVTLTALAADAMGDFDCVLKLANADFGDAEGPGAARMKALFGSVAGLGGRVRVSPQGLVKSATVEPPPSAAPVFGAPVQSMVSSMGQLTVPLPDAPVGQGARWRVVTQSEVSGIALAQTAEYRIAEVRDADLVLEMTVRQALRIGTRGSSEERALVGHGRMVWNASRMGPRYASLEIHNEPQTVSVTITAREEEPGHPTARR